MAKQAAKQSISKYWKGKVTSDFSLVKSHFKDITVVFFPVNQITAILSSVMLVVIHSCSRLLWHGTLRICPEILEPEESQEGV